ncbi:MAG: DUF4097 family beta strand repeat protein [Bryobacteraceae bacterium]|nr:DUF4097 family beta strand repeat protein [Bryobacteraceae bacterium]
MLQVLRISVVACASLLLTGCEEWADWGDGSRYKEDFSFTYPLRPQGSISVESLNGSVEVMGWDQDRVEITGSKHASSESALKALRIDIVNTPDSVRIRTIPPSGHRGGMGARYVLRVPRKAQIERIQSSNGRIQIDDIESAARLKTSNGSVRVNRTRGNIEVETSNASVELVSHDGSAVVTTSNGTIKADQVRGYFEAHTSNSSINARVTDPEPGKPLKLETSNGSITVAFDSLNNNEIRAATSNSSITLKLPATLNAQLKARTSNSSISTDFDVNVRGSISKNALDGTIGSGGPVIDLATSNGTIRVQRL